MNVAINQYCFNHSLKCIVLIVRKLSFNLNCKQFKFFFQFNIFYIQLLYQIILYKISQKFVPYVQHTLKVPNVKITKRTGIKKLKTRKDGICTQHSFLFHYGKINK